MWQLFLVTLVAAVSTTLGQATTCSFVTIGETTPNLVLLNQRFVEAGEILPIDTGSPCRGKRVLGLFVNACNVDLDDLSEPEITYNESKVYLLQVKSWGSATVDLVGFCEEPLSVPNRSGGGPVKRRRH